MWDLHKSEQQGTYNLHVGFKIIKEKKSNMFQKVLIKLDLFENNTL